MELFRYIVRLQERYRILEFAKFPVCPTTIFMCQAQDEHHAMEQAEEEYPGCEFLSSERIEYPEPY